jgi:DNA replication protein DnaC
MSEQINGHLRSLKFNITGQQIDPMLSDATRENLGCEAFLTRVLEKEVQLRRDRRIASELKRAKFPVIKRMEDFDFGFQPSINRNVIAELEACGYIEQNENVLLLGMPGTGKSHLSGALGRIAVEKGYRTLFVSAASLVTSLVAAQMENRLERQLSIYTQPRLLIIDEVGYVPFDNVGAACLFQLINSRYEKGSMIINSNRSPAKWSEFTGAKDLASASLDRLLHHAIIINISGDSYRLKDKVMPEVINSQVLATAKVADKTDKVA